MGYRTPAGRWRRAVVLAVPVGFEPTVDFHPHNFSRVAPSAARTRHRGQRYYKALAAAGLKKITKLLGALFFSNPTDNLNRITKAVIAK